MNREHWKQAGMFFSSRGVCTPKVVGNKPAFCSHQAKRRGKKAARSEGPLRALGLAWGHQRCDLGPADPGAGGFFWVWWPICGNKRVGCLLPGLMDLLLPRKTILAESWDFFWAIHSEGQSCPSARPRCLSRPVDTLPALEGSHIAAHVAARDFPT